MEPNRPEPWLRGTRTEVEPVKRQILHALDLAVEDVERWCKPLTAEQMHQSPFGLASVAFHVRHIARSLDRLLTYAEGGSLDAEQMQMLASEMETGVTREALLTELREGMERAENRILAVRPETFAEMREVGRRRLPVPVAGLLIHCAEHTQRHAGQLVTTAKLVAALSNSAEARDAAL